MTQTCQTLLDENSTGLKVLAAVIIDLVTLPFKLIALIPRMLYQHVYLASLETPDWAKDLDNAEHINWYQGLFVFGQSPNKTNYLLA